MKTDFLPKWLTKQLLNHLFLWEISTTKIRYPDAWFIDYTEVEKYVVRHKIFRGCAVILGYKPKTEDIPELAIDWLKTTGWIK